MKMQLKLQGCIQEGIRYSAVTGVIMAHRSEQEI